MKTCTAILEGVSPYSQSRHYDDVEVPKKPKESHGDYELRTWRSRMHVTKDGHVEIPAMAFSNAVKTSAQRLGIPVPGKRGALYTKYFEAGVLVVDGIVLPIKAEDVPHDRLFVPSDGRRGGGTRVTKLFPRIDTWSGPITYHIFDDLITVEVFKQVLIASGQLVGIGRFRPERSGFYGRYAVKEMTWAES